MCSECQIVESLFVWRARNVAAYVKAFRWLVAQIPASEDYHHSNSILRNSKALFSRKLMPFLSEEIELSNPLPFDAIISETAISQQHYRTAS